MKVNFGYLHYTMMFVYTVDLADLVTLIDWSSEVSLSELKKINIGYMEASGSIFDSDLHKTATLIEFSKGIRIDYVGAYGRYKPPIKKDQNMVFGTRYEVDQDGVSRMVGFINTKTKKILGLGCPSRNEETFST